MPDEIDQSAQAGAEPDNQQVEESTMKPFIFKLAIQAAATAFGLALLLPTPWALAAQTATYIDVAPIFQGRCIFCHSGESSPLNLQLDTYDNVVKGSERGPVVVSGKPGNSELIRRLKGISQPQMPLTGPPYLDKQEIGRIGAWIAGGLKDGETPDATAAVPPPRRRPGPGEPVAFSDVAPIFLKRCVKCHTDNGKMGPPPEGLRLKSRDLILSGAERAVVIPGVPGASELVKKINGTSLPRMPFDGPPYLPPDDIRLITDWVAQGAPDDDGNRAPIPVGTRTRLHGTITGPGELDGFAVLVGGRGEVGEYVRVRGTVTSDGRIRVNRLQRRSRDDNGEDDGRGGRRRRGRGGRK